MTQELKDILEHLGKPYPPMGSEEELQRLANAAKAEAILHGLMGEITYEVSGNEPLHPDPDVCNRMKEYYIGPCEYGCKVYGDPRSNVRVLAHNSSYGCPK